jgi:hypothetical protein
MRLEDTMDTFVTEDTGDKILIDVQLEAASPLKLEAEDGKILTEDGVDNFSITIVTTGSFRRFTFIPAGSFMGEDSVLQSIMPTEELDTPADVLAQNEEFEEVASDGETIGGVEEVSFIDFSEVDPFSDGDF